MSLVSAEEPSLGTVWRGFKKDEKPAEGWSVDLAVNDHLKYLPAGSDVHLRHTELTRGAEVELAEAWVSVGLYGGTADGWIPSFLVSRRAEHAPLASTFVSVLEPYETKSNLAGSRRLDLQDAEGKPCAEEDVGIEVRLADGRKDIFLSRQVEVAATSSSSPPGHGVVVEKSSGARFEGDLGLIRFDAAGRPERVWFCRGKMLRMGSLLVRARDAEASFEISLDRDSASVVAGPPSAVELIEMAGAKIWPK